MRAFDFVITLYSFVYALAVAQILSTVGDMIRAGKRLRFSWINAGWMLNVLLAIVAAYVLHGIIFRLAAIFRTRRPADG